MKKFLLMVVLSVVLSFNLFAAFNVVNIKDEFGDVINYKVAAGYDNTGYNIIRFDGEGYIDIIFGKDYVMTYNDIGQVKFKNEKGAIISAYFYFENGEYATLEGEEVAEVEGFFKKSSTVSIAIVDYEGRTWNCKFDASGFTKALNSLK